MPCPAHTNRLCPTLVRRWPSQDVSLGESVARGTTPPLALRGNYLETNEGRVYFALDGDNFEPDDVTKLLGIEPTSVKRKGSRVPGKIPNTNSWQLSTENTVHEYIDVFEMAKEIINKLIPVKDLIIQAKKRFNVSARLEVVLWFSMNEEHSTPAIGFEVDTVKFLGEIGAFIDIDTYKH